MPNMWFIFHKDILLRSFLPVLDINQDPSLNLPSGDFSDEVMLFLFRDAIHHKYSIKMPKQQVILLRTEWKTRWSRFRFDTLNSFCGLLD